MTVAIFSVTANAGTLTKQLPGHDIGVVFHSREQHLVARTHALAKGVGHQVDRLGGPAQKHDLPFGMGMDEIAHAVPGCLIGSSRAFGKGMHPAVHIRVVVAIEAIQRLDHLTRLLGRSGVVKIG